MHDRLELVGGEEAAATRDAELHTAERGAGAALEVDRVRSLADDDVVARRGSASRSPSWLPIVPLVTKSAASLPVMRATSSSSAITVGSSPKTSSPTSRPHHGLAHRRRRPGDRVAPEVDHGRRATAWATVASPSRPEDVTNVTAKSPVPAQK